MQLGEKGIDNLLVNMALEKKPFKTHKFEKKHLSNTSLLGKGLKIFFNLK
jgi:hypothetical protein